MHRPVVILSGLAVLLVAAVPASAVVHDVQQQGFVFTPAELTVNRADTVRWHWNDGTHTVTNGTDPSDQGAGTLFDAPLDGGHTTFEYTFDTAGTFPYYCTFHYTLGMTGTVTVSNDTPVEASTWSRIKALYGSAGK